MLGKAGAWVPEEQPEDTQWVAGCRFNVYVAQPEVKPGCVIRRSNISLLEKKKLVSDKEVRSRGRGVAWC